MTVSYFNSRSLNLNTQRSYGSAISNSGSVLNKCPSCNGILFGMKVQQTAPDRYLNTSNPCGESFHNPFSDCRFPKVLVRVLYRREPEKSKPLKTGIDGLPSISKEFRELSQPRAVSFEADAGQKRHFSFINSIGSDGERPLKRMRHGEGALMSTLRSKPSGLLNKTKAQQNDENILYTSQSGLRIERVWSVAFEENSRTHSISANPSSRDATLKDTAGNSSSGMGRSTPQISSVVDNTSQKQFEKRKAACKVYEQSEKGKATRKAYEQSEQRKAARKAYRQSDKSKAYQKTYRQSDKGKASSRAYCQSDKGKASRRAYRQSDRGQASRRAYEQSKKRKAYIKTYQKAYYEVLNKTGDREQAKIAGKQATAFMRKLNKSGNSEPDSITVSPITPRLSD